MNSFRNHLFRPVGIALTILASFLPTLHGQDEDKCSIESENTIVHYCNLDASGEGPGGAALKIAPFPTNDYLIGTAQKFTVGEVGNVSSVTIAFSQNGSPGGKMEFSIREVDDSTGNPGELVGILGEVDLDTLPEIDWCSLPTLLETVTVEGLVTGLEPGTDYFLHMIESEEDPPVITGGGACGPGSVWIFDLVPTPEDPGPALVDWPDAEFPPGAWVPWEDHLRLRARIEGTRKTNIPLNIDIDPAVAISWDSQADKIYEVHSSTDLENWTVAVDAIQGTGENLTHFFIRSKTEIFYRVEESN